MRLFCKLCDMSFPDGPPTGAKILDNRQSHGPWHIMLTENRRRAHIVAWKDDRGTEMDIDVQIEEPELVEIDESFRLGDEIRQELEHGTM